MNDKIQNIYKNLVNFYKEYEEQIKDCPDCNWYYGNFFTIILKTDSNKNKLIHIEHYLDLLDFFENYKAENIIYICEHFPLIVEGDTEIEDYGIDNINGKIDDGYDYMNSIYDKFGVENND